MTRAGGQALAEYVGLLAAVVAALLLPVVAGESIVVRLSRALRFYWREWSVALLNVVGCS
ncbi:MAG: hypothetical protein CMLOHMNK_00158 [Steroidobacteraceae bacterium]|nr:hypothetical protein [Steroidobacteraceae bacterium]